MLAEAAELNVEHGADIIDINIALQKKSVMWQQGPLYA